MPGTDRYTGKRIDDYVSALQGVEDIFGTPLATRVMLREYGGGVIELLGRAITPQLFAAWQQIVGTAIDLWEPRFLVRQVQPSGSAEDLRAGTAGLIISCDFRPRGHLGDMTVERVVSFGVRFGRSRVEVAA